MWLSCHKDVHMRQIGRRAGMKDLLLSEYIRSESAFFHSNCCSQYLDEDDAESQKFLANGIMKKKKFEEYHEEYVSWL